MIEHKYEIRNDQGEIINCFDTEGDTPEEAHELAESKFDEFKKGLSLQLVQE
jgi:hypothetical protein